MRLLFVAPYIPLATKPRPFRFLQHLARTHEVHLVAFEVAPDARYAERSDFQELRNLCASMTLLPLPRWQRYRNVLGSIPTATPARVAYYGIPRVKEDVCRIADRLRIEVVHVDRLRLAGLGAALPQPKIVDATDCISDYLTQCMQQVAPPLKAAYAFEAAKTVRFERAAAANYDRCLVTTERERLLYADATYFDRVEAVPNLLDERWFDEGRCAPVRVGDAPTVLFVGNLAYRPNVDAVRLLTQQIWPHVRAAVPDARLVLAGADPHPTVRRMAREAGAELTGFVS